MSRFGGPLVPVIFSVSFRDPAGYFLATRLQMRNDDIIFVANAHSVDSAKFLNYVNLFASTAISTAVAVQQPAITSAIVHGHSGLPAAPSRAFAIGPTR